MACRAAVLMHVLRHGLQVDVLLIACAEGALTSRCAAGCVQVLMCVLCSRRHRMAGVVCNVMLLMYELLFDVCNAVLMFVSGAGCSRARRGAGCVQVLMCVWCSRRHRMAGVACNVMLLMYELLFDVCNAVLMFVSGAGCSRARRGAGRVQAQVVPDCRRLADVATQHRGQP
jgi:hypothetical protein